MEKRRKVALDAAIYKRPAEGSPESADPFFVARVRGCGVKGGVNLDHFGGAKVDQLVKG